MPGEWTDKAWGRKRELLREPLLLIEELEIEAGGYCSLHRHCSKTNFFCVIEGALTVSVSSNRHILWPGQSLLVRELNDHQFTAGPRPVRLIEITQAIGYEPIDEGDILRFGEGGVHRSGRPAA